MTATKRPRRHQYVSCVKFTSFVKLELFCLVKLSAFSVWVIRKNRASPNIFELLRYLNKTLCPYNTFPQYHDPEWRQDLQAYYHAPKKTYARSVKHLRFQSNQCSSEELFLTFLFGEMNSADETSWFRFLVLPTTKHLVSFCFCFIILLLLFLKKQNIHNCNIPLQQLQYLEEVNFLDKKVLKKLLERSTEITAKCLKHISYI